MLFPSVLAILIPDLWLFSVLILSGLLIGATSSPSRAYSWEFSGAFDNAKIHRIRILEGHGKGTAAHKSAVTGDTTAIHVRMFVVLHLISL